MSTLVSFHAHPDDECLTTGGTIAKVVAQGHRVVLVVATGGEEGEYPEGFISSQEELGPIRREELRRSTEILGVERLYFLGYRDSGMAGSPANSNPDCFANADVADAAGQLAGIIVAEGADALTIYDENGGYGHPDHVMVNRVGLVAAKLAQLDDVLAATMNRDFIAELMRTALAENPESIPEEMRANFDTSSFGTPASVINTEIDVSDYVRRKYDALAAHQSQVQSTGFAFSLSDDAFAAAFSTEWFISLKSGVETRRSIF